MLPMMTIRVVKHLRDRCRHLVDGVGEVAVIDAKEQDVGDSGRVERYLNGVAGVHPGHGGDLVGAPVEHETECGEDNHHVHGGVLRRHDTQRPEDFVVRPAQRLQLLVGEHQCVRCEPDEESADQDDGDIFDVFGVALGAVAAPHATPQIIVGGQKQRPDQHRLNDEQPGEDATHEGDTHLLGVSVNLGRQIITGKRQRQQCADGDEVGVVTHPVIVGAFLFGGGGEELERRIGADDGAAIGNVGDEAVDVDGVPEEVVNRPPTHYR